MHRFYHAKFTISQQLRLLNVLVFGFTILLAAAYLWQIQNLEKKIDTMEHFEEFLQDILELRRYEKDLFLNERKEYIDNIFTYLGRIRADIKELENQMKRITNPEDYKMFKKSFDSYVNLMKVYRENRKELLESKESIRKLGKNIVNFATHLVEKKRKHIKTNLHVVLYVFTVIPGIAIMFMVIGVYIQTKNVLNRLQFLHQATRDVLKEKFKPIKDESAIEDEVSDLIKSFNIMAVELDKKTHELIQKQKLAAIGTFSSGIAHELNNPLNNISLSVDTLMEEYDTMSKDEVKEILQDIFVQTERAGAIVRNLLDFSRAEEENIQELQVNEIIEDTRKLIENELLLHSVHLDTYIPKDLPSVIGDRNKLQQVFLNLFINAIHAMPDGGLICIDAHCEPNGYIKINVSDTGVGIPQDKIEKIFDPFYTTKKVGKGTGLGLSIVYGIVKKHGGYIEVTSKVNVGTTFSVFLPILTECDKDKKGKSGEETARTQLNGKKEPNPPQKMEPGTNESSPGLHDDDDIRHPSG